MFFGDDIRLTIQPMDGIYSKQAVLNMLDDGTPIVPLSIAYADQYVNMLDADPPIGLCGHDSPDNTQVNY